MSWDMNMEEKMSKVRRVYSEKMPAFAVKAKELSDEISNYLNINTVKNVRVLIRYDIENISDCLLYTSPSPRDGLLSRMPSSA